MARALTLVVDTMVDTLLSSADAKTNDAFRAGVTALGALTKGILEELQKGAVVSEDGVKRLGIIVDELVKQIDPAAGSMLDYFEFLREHGYVRW